MPKQIPISGGRYFATVDDEDFERLNQYRWHCQEKNTNVYAQRTVQNPDGTRRLERMHKAVARFYFPDADLIDHIDGNGLNNTAANLRPATGSQNGANRKIVRSNTGYIGVSWIEDKGKHLASVQCGSRREQEYFDDVFEARDWRDAMALELFGEFAVLNVPRDGESKLRPPSARPHKAKGRSADRPFIGVFRHPDGRADYWYSNVRVGDDVIYLGVGTDPKRLARLRDCAVIVVHGTKARLNFPRESYTDAEIQAAKEMIEVKVAATQARKALTVTAILGVSYKVKAA